MFYEFGHSDCFLLYDQQAVEKIKSSPSKNSFCTEVKFCIKFYDLKITYFNFFY